RRVGRFSFVRLWNGGSILSVEGAVDSTPGIFSVLVPERYHQVLSIWLSHLVLCWYCYFLYTPYYSHTPAGSSLGCYHAAPSDQPHPVSNQAALTTWGRSGMG